MKLIIGIVIILILVIAGVIYLSDQGPTHYGSFTDVSIKTVIPYSDIDDPKEITIDSFMGYKVVLTEPLTINGKQLDTLDVEPSTWGFGQLILVQTYPDNKYVIKDLEIFSYDGQKFYCPNTFLKKI